MKRFEQFVGNKPDNDLFGTDWAFPLRANMRGDIATVSGMENLRQALIDHVDTIAGEDIYQENYGAGSPAYLHGPDDESTLFELAKRIENQIMTYEARIKTVEVIPVRVISDTGKAEWSLNISFETMFYAHRDNFTHPLREKI